MSGQFKCGRPTNAGVPCNNPVAQPGKACTANHPKAGPFNAVFPTPPTPTAADLDPLDPTAYGQGPSAAQDDTDIVGHGTADFASIAAGIGTLGDTDSIRAEAEATAHEAIAHAGAFMAGHGTTADSIALLNTTGAQIGTALAGAKGMPVTEQVQRLGFAISRTLLAAAAMDSLSQPDIADPPVQGDITDAGQQLDSALAATVGHGTLSADAMPNVRTGRHRARKQIAEAFQMVQAAGPDGLAATAATASATLIGAAQTLAATQALIKQRDNDAHQAVKLGTGGLALPAIGSTEILETPEQVQANTVDFHTAGAADDADEWLKGLDG